MNQRREKTGWAALAALAMSLSPAGAQLPPADGWLGGEAVYPETVLPSQIRTNRFASLGAEVVADKLKIEWKNPGENGGPASGSDNANRQTDRNPAGKTDNTENRPLWVRLVASQDKPGHWPARDWRSWEMSRAGESWEFSPPVEDLDIPIVYFVWTADKDGTNASPMRVCLPREAGLDAPTRLFWPFLEGFESGIDGWTLMGAAADDPPLRVSPEGKSGHGALLALPTLGKKRSTTIGTTRLRGSRMVSVGATGVSFWMKTLSGKGRSRFTLYADAFTTNEIAASAVTEAKLGPIWKKVTLPLDAFPRVPPGRVDFFAIELIAEDATGFLLDDVQWLGPWKTD